MHIVYACSHIERSTTDPLGESNRWFLNPIQHGVYISQFHPIPLQLMWPTIHICFFVWWVLRLFGLLRMPGRFFTTPCCAFGVGMPQVYPFVQTYSLLYWHHLFNNQGKQKSIEEYASVILHFELFIVVVFRELSLLTIIFSPVFYWRIYLVFFIFTIHFNNLRTSSLFTVF